MKPAQYVHLPFSCPTISYTCYTNHVACDLRHSGVWGWKMTTTQSLIYCFSVFIGKRKLLSVKRPASRYHGPKMPPNIIIIHGHWLWVYVWIMSCLSSGNVSDMYRYMLIDLHGSSNFHCLELDLKAVNHFRLEIKLAHTEYLWELIC